MGGVPIREQVVRRARVRGLDGLGDAELLALIVGPGRETGERLLRSAGGIRGLADSSVRELSRAPGVGEARALRVLAGIELGRRAATESADRDAPIRSSADIHARLAPRMAPLTREVFVALGLDVRGRIHRELRVAEGGLDECVVSPRDVFRPLVRCGAATCIIVHNHPSGTPQPSAQDRLLTLRMVEAGRLLGLRVLDHVIVAAEGWYSFRDEGII